MADHWATDAVANWYNTDTLTSSPTQVNIMIFAGILSIVSLLVLEVLPKLFPRCKAISLPCISWASKDVAKANLTCVHMTNSVPSLGVCLHRVHQRRLLVRQRHLPVRLPQQAPLLPWQRVRRRTRRCRLCIRAVRRLARHLHPSGLGRVQVRLPQAIAQDVGRCWDEGGRLEPMPPRPVLPIHSFRRRRQGADRPTDRHTAPSNTQRTGCDSSCLP